MKMSEDEVRERMAQVMGITGNIKNVRMGVGQLTSFCTILGKERCERYGINKNLKPDMWYLPENYNDVAIVGDAKKCPSNLEKEISQVRDKYMVELSKMYDKVVGFLWNVDDIIVMTRINGELTRCDEETQLMPKEYYIKKITDKNVDSNKIKRTAQMINDLLHDKCKMETFAHRSIFTASALVASVNGANLKGQTFEDMKKLIISKLQTLRETNVPIKNKLINLKRDVGCEISDEEEKVADVEKAMTPKECLIAELSAITMNFEFNQLALDQFVEYIESIKEDIQSSHWKGDDIMSIFFNEFNRYKGKAEMGQVFTPKHIANFIIKLLNIQPNDVYAECSAGVGTFVIPAANIITKNVGGVETREGKEILKNNIIEIEISKNVCGLNYANCLINKIDNVQLYQADSRSEDVGELIKRSKVNKVASNVPFENKHGCLEIIRNVMDNMEPNGRAAWILPDKKFEKNDRIAKHILSKHRLTHIIKLPENTFHGIGAITSIFIFTTHEPQVQNGEAKEVLTFYFEDDGLQLVKHKGRIDEKGVWEATEKQWLTTVERGEGRWIKPDVKNLRNLSYSNINYEVHEDDFVRTIFDYLMYECNKEQN